MVGFSLCACTACIDTLEYGMVIRHSPLSRRLSRSFPRALDQLTCKSSDLSSGPSCDLGLVRAVSPLWDSSYRDHHFAVIVGSGFVFDFASKRSRHSVVHLLIHKFDRSPVLLLSNNIQKQKQRHFFATSPPNLAASFYALATISPPL